MKTAKTVNFSLPVYNSGGSQVETLELDAGVFDGMINTAAVYQAVDDYRDNQRKGLASTKTMGEVSGGGRKPWKQKGTGRARVGSIRSPLWRHGGVVFGPHPRDFSSRLPKRLKALALKGAFCAKLKENNLVILDKFSLDKPKTKEALKVFFNLKLISKKRNSTPKTLLLLDKTDAGLKQALRNIDFLDVNLAKATHTYEVLAHKKLIITKDALRQLTERLKK